MTKNKSLVIFQTIDTPIFVMGDSALLNKFIEERCITDPNRQISSTKLYQEYAKFVPAHLRKYTHREFACQIQRSFPKQHTRSGNVFLGLDLRVESDLDLEFAKQASIDPSIWKSAKEVLIKTGKFHDYIRLDNGSVDWNASVAKYKPLLSTVTGPSREQILTIPLRSPPTTPQIIVPVIQPPILPSVTPSSGPREQRVFPAIGARTSPPAATRRGEITLIDNNRVRRNY